MSILTNWGYTLTDVNVLEDILTPAEFHSATANKYAGDISSSGSVSIACWMSGIAVNLETSNGVKNCPACFELVSDVIYRSPRKS